MIIVLRNFVMMMILIIIAYVLIEQKGETFVAAPKITSEVDDLYNFVFSSNNKSPQQQPTVTTPPPHMLPQNNMMCNPTMSNPTMSNPTMANPMMDQQLKPYDSQFDLAFAPIFSPI